MSEVTDATGGSPVVGTSVLVVGGTGLIGGRIAADLLERGAAVTLMSRSAAGDGDAPTLRELPRLVGDYAGELPPARELEGFDSVVFAAGSDIRHVSEADEDAEFWRRTQSEGVPRFAAHVKAAGVSRFVQIGSYYHQLRPQLAQTVPYVAARKAADEGARALSDKGFAAITVNPPSIVGVAPGRSTRRFARMLAWLRGELPEPRVFAPAGGTNYLSLRSLSEAVIGALEHGEAGRAYLVGDANLRFREYFQLLADAAGSTLRIEERDENQPYQPDRFIVPGRGSVISYEPDPAEVRLLGYRQGDVPAAVEEIVRACA
ncbi:NAD-dependent epimerase/dehydratase family protein [Herbiconiux sp. P17]|uniref:NAD-dependent epimerase/dehydratase family protein n=1 Tax=Herbiconiux wuyangfengii TaxID=3342794 RepID=UPI0035B8E827